MMATIFFTGFPGFLGSELLPRALCRRPSSSAICLVQRKFADLARGRAAALQVAHPELHGRIRIVEGDITAPDLALGSTRVTLVDDVVEIYHLAAVYDLSVPRDVGMRVNVDGTRNLLAFARECARLERLQYVSTCYVSGRYDGVFAEDDLEKGQHFNNFYEETKYLAEIDVREAIANGLPAIIYRPSVVVGDSRTGATLKYDGPYYAIRLILRQPKIAIFPVVGPPQTLFNMVPCDFVIGAIAYLSGRNESAGHTFHLADPEPLSVDAILRELSRVTNRRVIRIRLPRKLAKFAIERVPGIYPLLRIPSTTVDYMSQPTRYATAATTAALAGSGVVCPRVTEYLRPLVDFVLAHPDVESKAMA